MTNGAELPLPSQNFTGDHQRKHAPLDDPERKLLDQVLQQTVSVLGDFESTGSVAPAFLQILREVAARHFGEPVTEPRAAVDLIESTLEYTWPGWSQSVAEPRGLLDEIVDALLEDPSARTRLQAIWATLSEPQR